MSASVPPPKSHQRRQFAGYNADILTDQALEWLNEREKAIFQARRLQEEPKTLEELAQVYNVSRERIRQIEVRAFEKVQEAVQEAARARAGEDA